jgi:carbamoyl-phosphate synthase large subunit
MGGQTALNLCKEAEDLGVWERYKTRLIGVDIKAIDKAEDREKFRQWMIRLKVPVATAKTAKLVFWRERNMPRKIGFSH